MLVLTRKEGQSLMIGNHTVVTLLAIKGKQTRIGIDTPKGIPVLRSEIYEKELYKRQSEKGSPFPELYRIWLRATDQIIGYALDIVQDNPRYYYDPITSPKELTLDDHFLDLYLFSSEAEAQAMVQGIKSCKKHMKSDDSPELGTVYSRKGSYWVVLIDYFQTTLHDDRPERVKLFDYTLYRHDGGTYEASL